MSDGVSIREGTKQDLPAVLELIKELAAYERAPHEVTNTVARMEADGFGPHPLYGLFVAEVAGRIVGISIYYYRYSTWKGKRLYLEDIIVTESVRGRGIGKALFDRTMEKMMEEGCTGMMWQVLEWNEAAMAFYKQYNPRIDGEWVNFSVEADEAKRLLNRVPPTES